MTRIIISVWWLLLEIDLLCKTLKTRPFSSYPFHDYLGCENTQYIIFYIYFRGFTFNKDEL